MLPAEPATTVPPTPLPPAATDTPIEPEDTAPLAREEIEHTLRGVGIGEELVHELIEAAVAHVLALMPPPPASLRPCTPR